MDRARPIVVVICAAALAGALAVVVGVVGAARVSGRPALTETAQAFTKALSAPSVDTKALDRFLAPGVTLKDPRVLRTLDTLRQTLQSGSLVAEVRTTGADRGETDVLVLSPGRRGASASSLTFQWTRTPRGTWVIDPVAR